MLSLKARYLDAYGRYRILDARAHPRFSPHGEFLGMIGANVDVTERDEAEKARELLVEELNHRVKNTLSVVQAIAHQTFSKNADPSEARRAFEGRLIALGQAHDLLTHADWENASLTELAEVTLDSRGANQHSITLTGPQIPNLTYMVTYPSIEARGDFWKAFGADPEKARLFAIPEYADKLIVSKIHSTFLKPLPGSMI